MPIFDIRCTGCGFTGEVVQTSGQLACPSCGSGEVEKLVSATSTLTGRTPGPFPGAGDTGCCGASPAGAGCAGPGSCCGKRPG
jgi:putative FmdB family regulatory protein